MHSANYFAASECPIVLSCSYMIHGFFFNFENKVLADSPGYCDLQAVSDVPTQLSHLSGLHKLKYIAATVNGGCHLEHHMQSVPHIAQENVWLDVLVFKKSMNVEVLPDLVLYLSFETC